MSSPLRSLLLVFVLLSACGGSASPAAAQPHPQPSGYAVTVRSGGHVVGHLDLAALRSLPAIDVSTPQSTGKQVQHGPRVRAALSHAGVQKFSKLRAVALAGTAQTFTSAEIDDQVVLDFDNRGTVKLAGAHLATTRWVREVTELDAEA